MKLPPYRSRALSDHCTSRAPAVPTTAARATPTVGPGIVLGPARHDVPCAPQLHPGSTLHMASQPSSPAWLPSSHPSAGGGVSCRLPAKLACSIVVVATNGAMGATTSRAPLPHSMHAVRSRSNRVVQLQRCRCASSSVQFAAQPSPATVFPSPHCVAHTLAAPCSDGLGQLQPRSTVHAAEQPSPRTRLPSSQSSLATTTPSPHPASHA